jgi:hypothetical protein
MPRQPGFSGRMATRPSELFRRKHRATRGFQRGRIARPGFFQGEGTGRSTCSGQACRSARHFCPKTPRQARFPAENTPAGGLSAARQRGFRDLWPQKTQSQTESVFTRGSLLVTSMSQPYHSPLAASQPRPPRHRMHNHPTIKHLFE